MYHVVAAPSAAERTLPALDVPPGQFNADLDALAAGRWHTITLETLATDLANSVEPDPRTIVLTFDDGHADGFTNVLPALQRHGFVATFFVIGDRIGRRGYLSANQLRTMAAAGMEIGDHTLSHLDLTTLSTTGIRNQLGGDASAIAAAVGLPPATIAYPYGRVDRRVVAVARSLGFALAVTTRAGATETTATRLVVPRIRVSPGMTGGALLARIESLV